MGFFRDRRGAGTDVELPIKSPLSAPPTGNTSTPYDAVNDEKRNTALKNRYESSSRLDDIKHEQAKKSAAEDSRQRQAIQRNKDNQANFSTRPVDRDNPDR